jgi:hypothetical protein
MDELDIITLIGPWDAFQSELESNTTTKTEQGCGLQLLLAIL